MVVAEDCAALRVTHHACRRGWASLGALPAGTYYVLVGAASATSDEGGPFTLDVRVRTPAVALPGDTCPEAVALTPGTATTGDLFGGTNSQALAAYSGTICGSTGYGGEVDVFYRFTLPAPRHLDVRVTADTLVHTAVFTDCSDIRGSTVACNAVPYGGTRSGLTWRDAPAGDYLLRLQTASTSPAPRPVRPRRRCARARRHVREPRRHDQRAGLHGADRHDGGELRRPPRRVPPPRARTWSTFSTWPRGPA